MRNHISKKYLGVDHSVWVLVVEFATELGGIKELLREIVTLRKEREAMKQANLDKILEDLE